ncbi:MAG: rhomboid family intramembrane serine protease, partial [Armatimonadetes bacterium]|nr:rhomboid family intramembrane serine protease [Armatimonadota bacterium]
DQSVTLLRLAKERIATPTGAVPDNVVFLHGDVLHLGGNMLFLWLFATLTEDVFGPWLLLAVYFASDLGATLLHSFVGALFAPGALDIPVVGASGAIAGVMGLSAVCFLRTQVRVWYLFWFFLVFLRTGTVELGAPVFVGLWVGWEVIQGLLKTSLEAAYGGGGGVAHWAHVGGFGVGLGVALAMKLRGRVVRTDVVDGRRPAIGEFEAFAQSAEIEKMVQQSPEDAEAWYALGRARLMSGRPEKAGEAYARALELFLRQRQEEGVVRAFAGLKEHGEGAAVAAELRFPLACALAERAHPEDAFRLFRELAREGPKGAQTETALVRAGEIASSLPGYAEYARESFRKLLDEYPYGPWRQIALKRLKELEAFADSAGSGSAATERPSAIDEDVRHLGGPPGGGDGGG